MVSRKSGDNCKIRDDLMDIKRLKQINGDKLEQWCAVLKTSFPMLYVVVEELIPEMSQGKHSNIGTVFFAVGFSVMMTLDVALG